MLNLLLLSLTVVTSQDAVAAGAAAPARLIHLKVVNAGPRTLQAVYISPSSEPNWGDNLVAARPGEKGRPSRPEGLALAAKADVTVSGACGTYDILVVGEKGAEFLLDEVELCDDGDVLTVTDTQLTHVKARDLGQDTR